MKKPKVNVIWVCIVGAFILEFVMLAETALIIIINVMQWWSVK